MLDIRLGDCMERMQEIPPSSVEVVICDPPYFISFGGSTWDSIGRQQEYQERGGYKDKGILPHYGRGGSPQDRDAYHRRQNHEAGRFHYTWLQEAYKVLGSGGLMMAFSGTRTYHRLAAAMEDVGYEDIRTDAWVYGSGFPKSHNIAVYMDRMLTEGKSRTVKRKGVGNLNGRFADALVGFVSQSKAHRIQTPEALRWEGWGTAIKPAWEPVIVGRKP